MDEYGRTEIEIKVDTIMDRADAAGCARDFESVAVVAVWSGRQMTITVSPPRPIDRPAPEPLATGLVTGDRDSILLAIDDRLWEWGAPPLEPWRPDEWQSIFDRWGEG
jgi:hypothetical protein